MTSGSPRTEPGPQADTGAPGGAGRTPRPGARRPVAGARVPATGARGPLRAVPTAGLAAVTLVLAFAVAQGTGVRALGGVVLVLGVVWCAWRALPAAGVGRVGAVVALGAICFVASHLLAGALGAWPAVLLVAAVLAAGTWVLVDRTGTPG